jgi:oligoribonuclease (3'-5' exoribonuclease)
MNENLVVKVNNKIHENQRFTISKLLTCFPLISHTLLYKIVAERLHYHEICARWVPKMLMDKQKKAACNIILNTPSATQEQSTEIPGSHCEW